MRREGKARRVEYEKKRRGETGGGNERRGVGKEEEGGEKNERGGEEEN